MKTLDRILTVLMVFAFTTITAYAQREGNRGEATRNRTASVAPRQNHGESNRRGSAAAPRHDRKHAPARHEAPRPAVHHHEAHRPFVHNGHHCHPVRPLPAHHVHGRPHYVKHIDRHAHSFYVDNCKYYHHNGAFYRYYPGHGYGLVSVPYYSSFPVLPFPCRQVVVGPNVYWEGSGSWFCETAGGFVLVEAPVLPVCEVPVPHVEPVRPHVSVQLSF